MKRADGGNGMTEQEIKQAAIDTLAKFNLATFLYKFEVHRYDDEQGKVCATNTNGCEWHLFYTLNGDALEWTLMDVYRAKEPA
jgi:hypothetical protein